MHGMELDPSLSGYAEEDSDDLEYWPSASNIKIVRTGRPWPQICRDNRIREEEIQKLNTLLESTKVDEDEIRNQHESAKRNGNKQAEQLALVAMSKHLERTTKIKRHISRLVEESSPIQTTKE